MTKELANPESSYADLLTFPHEAVKWELLKTTIELKVFDHLK